MRATGLALGRCALEKAGQPSKGIPRLLPALVAVLFSLSAVGSFRLLDDHVLELQARGERALATAPITETQGLDLFRFTSGKPSDNLALMSQGSLLPWWSDPELKIAFYRPSSSLLHRLDFALWPDHPRLMYLHSLVWFGLLLVLVTRLYAQFEASAGSACLASWLYALNDAHGPVVGWLSNRNALVSAVGVVAMLLVHRRARCDGPPWRRVLAPLLLLLALLASELGLSAWAFLVSEALTLRTQRWVRSLCSLWPFLLVTSGWLLLRAASGAGAFASGVYLDPLSDLGAFARAFPGRALLLLGAAFGPVPADTSFFLWPGLGPLWLATAAVALLAFGWLAGRTLTWAPELRFWVLSTLLAVVPIAASFPSDRLLLLVNVGAMAIVARVLSQLWQLRRERGGVARALGILFLVVHAALAPLLLPGRARQCQQLGRSIQSAFATLDGVADLESKTALVLGAPADFVVSYLQAERAAHGLPRPAHLYWLANPGAELRLRLLEPKTLSVEREGGFFTTPAETLYRAPSRALSLGATVRLPELTARIAGTNRAGTPERIELTLDHPFDDERYIFLVFFANTFRRVSAANLAELRGVPPASLFAFLAGGSQ